jgi:hypothetical protein
MPAALIDGRYRGAGDGPVDSQESLALPQT